MEILLIGATILIVAALLTAWLMTFARWFPIPGIEGGFLKDYNTMIRAHIDYVLMALFCLGFYAIKIPLAVTACWLVVIGGIANPTIFVIAAFDPQCCHNRFSLGGLRYRAIRHPLIALESLYFRLRHLASAQPPSRSTIPNAIC